MSPKDECSLGNECLTSNIMYEARFSNQTNNEFKANLGASQTTLKERFKNRTTDFKHKKNEKYIKLLRYICCLKAHCITVIIKWSIVKRASSETSSNY